MHIWLLHMYLNDSANLISAYYVKYIMLGNLKDMDFDILNMNPVYAAIWTR